MKKILVISIGVLVLSTFLFFFLKKNTEVIIPFNHPLFLTRDDLISLKFSKYHFVENKDTLPFYKEKGYLFASTTKILSNKDSHNANDYILIDIYQHSNETSAKTDFDKRKYVNSKTAFKDDHSIENYQKIGENNFLRTLWTSDEYLAYLNILYKNYIVVIQVGSQKDLKEAKNQASLLGNFLIERIKKL